MGATARYDIVTLVDGDRPSSSTAEQWTFNPLVQGSNPWGATGRFPAVARNYSNRPTASPRRFHSFDSQAGNHIAQTAQLDDALAVRMRSVRLTASGLSFGITGTAAFFARLIRG